MRRYFLFVCYDGTMFHGSQIQGEQATVQYFVNKSLSTLLRAPILSYGASRTDEGVHALQNVYHFDTDKEVNDNFIYRLNAILPMGISVVAVKRTVNPEANCRFDAIARRYRYYLHYKKHPFLHNRSYYFPYSIDEGALHNTAAIIPQYTDFETFAKRNAQVYTYNCQIFESAWSFDTDSCNYTVTANRFLRGMVRALVGSQLQVGRGRYDVASFESRIIAKNCQLADFSVPGHGLFLEEIVYPDQYFDAEWLP